MAIEKVIITGSFQKGVSQKSGKPYFTVNLADGRQATCFDQPLSQTLNTEVEVDVKQSEYNGVVEYIINKPGGGPNGGGGGGGRGFDKAYNARKTALECATASMAGSLTQPGEIIERANLFTNWLNQTGQ